MANYPFEFLGHKLEVNQSWGETFEELEAELTRIEKHLKDESGKITPHKENIEPIPIKDGK